MIEIRSSQIHIFEDHIDTDRIIAGKYTKTKDYHDMATHIFEDLDRSFKDRVNTGDMIVAGYNFGCGSSREQAAIAIKYSGVRFVVAKSFARIFFRNAINIGLQVIEVPDHNIKSNSNLTYDGDAGTLFDSTYKKNYKTTIYPPQIKSIIEKGGLVNYVKAVNAGDNRL